MAVWAEAEVAREARAGQKRRVGGEPDEVEANAAKRAKVEGENAALDLVPLPVPADDPIPFAVPLPVPVAAPAHVAPIAPIVPVVPVPAPVAALFRFVADMVSGVPRAQWAAGDLTMVTMDDGTERLEVGRKRFVAVHKEYVTAHCRAIKKEDILSRDDLFIQLPLANVHWTTGTFIPLKKRKSQIEIWSIDRAALARHFAWTPL